MSGISCGCELINYFCNIQRRETNVTLALELYITNYRGDNLMGGANVIKWQSTALTVPTIGNLPRNSVGSKNEF